MTAKTWVRNAVLGIRGVLVALDGSARKPGNDLGNSDALEMFMSWKTRS